MTLLSSLVAVLFLTASLTSALPAPTDKPTDCNKTIDQLEPHCFSETHTRTSTKTSWSASTSWPAMTTDRSTSIRSVLSDPDFSHPTTYSHVTGTPGWVMPPPPAVRAEGPGPVADSSVPIDLGIVAKTDCKTLFFMGAPTVLCPTAFPTAHATMTKESGPGLPCLSADQCSTFLPTHHASAPASKLETSEPLIVGTLATYGPRPSAGTFSMSGFTLPPIPDAVTKATEHPPTIPTTHFAEAVAKRPRQDAVVTETVTITVDILTQTYALPSTTVEVTQSIYEWPTTTMTTQHKRATSTGTCTEELGLTITTSPVSRITLKSTFDMGSTTATFTDTLDVQYATITDPNGCVYEFTQTHKERPTGTSSSLWEPLQTE